MVKGSRPKVKGQTEMMRFEDLEVWKKSAEGFERLSQKECLSFLSYAKGSCGELRTQISMGMEIGPFTCVHQEGNGYE